MSTTNAEDAMRWGRPPETRAQIEAALRERLARDIEAAGVWDVQLTDEISVQVVEWADVLRALRGESAT